MKEEIDIQIDGTHTIANAMAQQWGKMQEVKVEDNCHDGIPPNFEKLGILPTIL